MATDHSLGELVRKAPRYATKILQRWVVGRYMSLYFRATPDHEAFDRDRAVEVARNADSMLLLCWGNVCRSPLAARYLQRRLAERGIDGVEVRGAGLGTTAGRPSPETAVDAASSYGVTLADHESERVTASLVEDSDVVFVMDYNNYHSVVSRFPDAEGKVFLLGAFAEGSRAVVPDPYGAGGERFDAVYGTIAGAVDNLVEAMVEGNG